MADARTISVQETVTSTGSGSSLTKNQRNIVASSSAGPSKTVIQFDCTYSRTPFYRGAISMVRLAMQGLPASIDVERFTEVRLFRCLIVAVTNDCLGAESSTHRAWQTLPRHLRRRAASHDVRRVPVRLRDKARAEMDANKRRLLGRPKRGKANQITHTEDYLKRQRDKSWLETHIWHAKRAEMQNIWGYRLAVTPTEKAFRPSHRASMHGSILHDASYYATIELKGPQPFLQATLERCCDPQDSPMTRYITGGRACDTHVYKHASYPFALLGPMMIIWQPSSPEGNSSRIPEPPARPGKEKGKGKGKGKGKEKQVDDSASPEPNVSPRVVWVRCHPAIFEDVFESLQTSASYVLEQSKKKDPQVHVEIEIVDLRGCINAFEIMGPKSSQVIKGALSPVEMDDRKDVKKFWGSLTGLQSDSIPRGMVIGLKVLDPRLKFPPKNAKPHYPDVAQPSTQLSQAFHFPTALTAQSEIWDEEKRGSLKKPKYKKKDLDDRRSKNLVPGTPLNPLRQDDRIPILLIQRSVEQCPSTSSSSKSPSGNVQGIYGWTLLFPAGWAMAFLSSLLYTGTRFAGQRERMKQFFEAGVRGFPNDYPAVAAYDIVTNDRAEQEKARWERTPPAKKPNYEKLGTRSPWRADWGVVLGLEKSTATQTSRSGGQGEEGLVSTQRENLPDSDAMRVDEEGSDLQPWLLRGSQVSTMLSNAFITPAQFLGGINKLREKNHMTSLDMSLSAEDVMRSGLLMVRAKMVRRGAPTDMANIYKMDDPEARKWIKTFEKQSQNAANWDESSKPNEHELGEIKPPQTTIIGYVTTGDVSLSRGEGFAIGAIPVVQYLALRKQALSED
ncbi:hypothetical protein J3R82DRAFT_10062 [Butyriboletus roseoflavus]|nr:hypothetical protein J3R82DRAFT_10062 [Butyriboletus roseoflavus]